MKLSTELERPVCFVKIQTTGLNPKEDRIIEIAVVKRFPGEEKEIVAITKINPGIDISEASTAINGITNEHVKNAPTFEAKAKGLLAFFEGCDFIGFSIKDFDLKFLTHEFSRSGLSFLTYDRNIVDLMQLHQKIEPRSLKAVSRKYLGKFHPEQPTSQDTITTNIALLNALINTHKGEVLDNGGKVTADIHSLGKLCNNRKTNMDLEGKIYLNAQGVPTFNFGKYKGKSIVESLEGDKSYQSWLLHSADKLEEDVRQIIEKLVSEANSNTQIA